MKATMAAASLTILLAGASAVRGTTLSDHLSTDIERPIARALSQSIARSVPIPAASSGVTFTIDLDSGAFVRDQTVLGQLFLERADPIGRRKWSLAVAYQHVEIDTFEGQRLDRLRDVRFPIVDRDTRLRFVIPRFGIGIDTHQVTTTVTYGIGDDGEANVTIPVLASAFGLDGVAQAPEGRNVDHVRTSKSGIGDIILRGKYRIVRRDFVHAALGLVLRLPSGNEENFQGAGTTELAPLLYVSRPALALGSGLTLTPYLNSGVNIDVEDVDGTEARWGVGVDTSAGDRFTLAIAVLGRHAFRRIAPAGAFDVTRANPTTGRTFVAPLFGIQNRRPDYYDISFGGRLAFWRHTLFGFVNVLLPLNRDGFRADVIPLAGMEVVF
jgi:hypothetical protein